MEISKKNSIYRLDEDIIFDCYNILDLNTLFLELDCLEDYEDWKNRSIERMKRIELNILNKVKEKEEKIRRMNMSDKQREEEDLKLGADANIRKFQRKYHFLQKTYMEPVFFKDENDEEFKALAKRDYNVATEEDKINRASLPLIMQKRRGDFGKKGQSKYTHLVNEDTTEYNPDYKIPDIIKEKIKNKLGGFKK
jgi:microfibrillar-associated protein 1